MAAYVGIKGDLQDQAIQELLTGLASQVNHAADVAMEAWGPDVLGPAGLGDRAALMAELGRLPDRLRNVFERVQFQIVKLQETIDRWSELGKGDRAAVHAMDLKRKLLGLRDDRYDGEADDRTGGHPMRRLAEFGILPGYEFPSAPCTLRLLGDKREEEPITVTRRFGIGQYQPEAVAHARGHRWKVVGLDLASPWNPKSPEPEWLYLRCKACELRYDAQVPQCPRCGSSATIGKEVPGHDYGGFIGKRDDTPVLQEEDRFAMSSLVGCQPQRDGVVAARHQLPTGWRAELRYRESVRWLNEGKAPSAEDLRLQRPRLHDEAKGFYLCGSCGRVLTVPESDDKKGGRKKARKGSGPDQFGHATECPQVGQAPAPVAITTMTPSTTLRLVAVLPSQFDEESYRRWGYSLGYALRTGLRRLYVLDGSEVEFLLETPWEREDAGGRTRFGALTFVDGAVGGSGFLDRAANELHLVAASALEHLDHKRCESACYRCLKAYTNQRHHEYLSWPDAVPFLEVLATEPPALLPKEAGDKDDPGPWLEAYAAGVGSPLELKFLRLFEKHGLEVEKQVAVPAEPGGPNISQADFRVKGTKTLIYVDGAAFHVGNRLRRDRAIRERLRTGGCGWRVEEVRAVDLGRGGSLVESLRSPNAPE